MQRDFTASEQTGRTRGAKKLDGVITLALGIGIGAFALLKYLGVVGEPSDASNLRFLLVGIGAPLGGLWYWRRSKRLLATPKTELRVRIDGDVVAIPGRDCGSPDLVDGYTWTTTEVDRVDLRIPMSRITAARRVTDPAELARVMQYPETFDVRTRSMSTEEQQSRIAGQVRRECVSNPKKLVAITVDRLEHESGDTRYGPTLVDFTAYVSVDEPDALVATLREHSGALVGM